MRWVTGSCVPLPRRSPPSGQSDDFAQHDRDENDLQTVAADFESDDDQIAGLIPSGELLHRFDLLPVWSIVRPDEEDDALHEQPDKVSDHPYGTLPQDDNAPHERFRQDSARDHQDVEGFNRTVHTVLLYRYPHDHRAQIIHTCDCIQYDVHEVHIPDGDKESRVRDDMSVDIDRRLVHDCHHFPSVVAGISRRAEFAFRAFCFSSLA